MIHCCLQVISYIRGPLLFVFNFHPTEAYERYSVGVEEAGEYQVCMVDACSIIIFMGQICCSQFLVALRII
jgi:hypothetical protein